MEKKTKAKLIWTVTNAGCQNLGVESIADVIVKNNISAVRMSYSQCLLPQIVQLRQMIDKKIAQKHHCFQEGLLTQNKEGYVPFLLSLIGRRAILFVPGQEIFVESGRELVLFFVVDFKTCASLSTQSDFASSDFKIVVSCEDQLSSLKKDSQINISYGEVELRILEIQNMPDHRLKARCFVTNGGVLVSGVDVHSSHMSCHLFPLLPEDEKSLSRRFSELADFVIVEGIRSEKEFFYLKAKILGENAPFSERHPSIPITKSIQEAEAVLPPRFLLKVDSKQTLDLLPSYLKHVDGLFLSRSELGREAHPHHLPIIQKDLIARCNRMSKTVIVASELMHSMRVHPNPTRAEVSDMANAAADGADALVLSHEVTEGLQRFSVAEVSNETLCNSEAWFEQKWHPFEMDTIPSDDDAVTYGAIRIAEQAKVKSIVCFTEGGYTAMKLSSMRTPIDIIAITCNKKIMRQLNMLRSVTSVVLNSRTQVETILSETKNLLVQVFHFKKGDKFVFVSLTASSVSERNSNLFTVQQID
jgi:pyruvate kinase